ncbi:hypothetical protein CFM90_26525 (plasmid) [Ralstonia solanacearum]|nr:hypothetical protein CFM90_26525 [Ralstonia solanacearum]
MADHRAEDPERNAATRVPEDEALHLRVLWAAEIFGPNEVEQLYAHLGRFDWRAGMGRDGAVDWVRQQRSYGFGGTYHVGCVTRRGDRSRWVPMPQNHAALPEPVDYLLVEIAQLTPSLTCVLIAFVLKDDASRCLEQLINRDQASAIEPVDDGTIILHVDPARLKRRALQQARDEHCKLVESWLRDNLAGYFCARKDRAQMPMAELTTTSRHSLFGHPGDPSRLLREDWRQVVTQSHTVWTLGGVERQGLRFAFSDAESETAPFYLMASLCIGELEPGTLTKTGWQEDSPASYVAYCHSQLQGVLENWAALVFLKEAAKDIKLARQAMQIGPLRRRQTVKALNRVQQFFDQVGGVSVAATELHERVREAAGALPECAHFESSNWIRTGPPRILATELLGRTGRLAREIVDSESALREHFTQLASVVSIRESIATQRKMEWLTYVAIGVAVVSLVVATLSVQDWTPLTNRWGQIKSGVSNIRFGFPVR